MTDENTATDGDDAEAEQKQGEATKEGDAGESDTDDPQAKLQADAERWKAMARRHEKAAKENAAAAKKLAELEDANKSETQKLNDQLSSAQVELQTLRVEKIRAQAARDAGLDPELAEYITAADPDEALSQAKRLAERLTPKAPKSADLRQGVRQPAKPAASVDDWIRSASGRS
jgi:hypothetical protein